MKNCSPSKCKQNNPQTLDNFGKDSSRTSGYSSQCKHCRKEATKRKYLQLIIV